MRWPVQRITERPIDVSPNKLLPLKVVPVELPCCVPDTPPTMEPKVLDDIPFKDAPPDAPGPGATIDGPLSHELVPPNLPNEAALGLAVKGLPPEGPMFGKSLKEPVPIKSTPVQLPPSRLPPETPLSEPPSVQPPMDEWPPAEAPHTLVGNEPSPYKPSRNLLLPL
nr:uncharacterized protein LOC126523020 [Dermacentor andersoni]